MEMTEIKPSELVNADVTIIINDRDGKTINGSTGVLNSKTSALGFAVLGKMQLGD